MNVRTTPLVGGHSDGDPELSEKTSARVQKYGHFLGSSMRDEFSFLSRRVERYCSPIALHTADI